MAQTDLVHPREAQIFPRLSDDMLARMCPYGTREALAEGSYLFHRGDRSVDFFVVLAGTVELIDEDATLSPVHLRCFGPAEFLGELNLVNNRAALVSARAGRGAELLRIPAAAFRRLTATEADIGELMMRAFILRRVELIAGERGGVTLVGSAHATDTHRIRTFLIRNAHPHRLLDPADSDEARHIVEAFALADDELPVVLLAGHGLLRRPSTSDLADALGITEPEIGDRRFDVAVVGAGPAGLAAAVYAASEGLDTVVIEAEAPGGQAGTSSRIENYLGFPTGISGQALAGRALVQAQKFGAHLAISRAATALDCTETPFRIALEGGDTLSADAIVVATGARYRRLGLVDEARFEGRGIYYAATPMEAQLCADDTVVVVGGGNSAGQAAVFLARTSRHVHILVRSEGLAASMSDYLVQRIDNSERITLHVRSRVVALGGDAALAMVGWEDVNGQRTTVDATALFVMIGADPNTAWLGDCLTLDAGGFVASGAGGAASPYATSTPGIFAVGDVRAGSVKRVASGVGEGSVVVSDVHRYLEALRPHDAE